MDGMIWLRLRTVSSERFDLRTSMDRGSGMSNKNELIKRQQAPLANPSDIDPLASEDISCCLLYTSLERVLQQGFRAISGRSDSPNGAIRDCNDGAVLIGVVSDSNAVAPTDCSRQPGYSMFSEELVCLSLKSEFGNHL